MKPKSPFEPQPDGYAVYIVLNPAEHIIVYRDTERSALAFAREKLAVMEWRATALIYPFVKKGPQRLSDYWALRRMLVRGSGDEVVEVALPNKII